MMENAQLPVNLVTRLPGPMPHQIMDAAIDEIPAVRPGRRDTARLAVMLHDPGPVAIHLAIATRGQSGYSRTDDDN